MRKAGLVFAQPLVLGVLTLCCVSCATTANEGDGVSSGARKYYNRGVAYAYEGDYDRAIADLDQAIKLDPNEAIIYINRGEVYYTKGDYYRAIADFESALQIDPNNTTAKDALEKARRAVGLVAMYRKPQGNTKAPATISETFSTSWLYILRQHMGVGTI